jgi:hypothetical protein
LSILRAGGTAAALSGHAFAALKYLARTQALLAAKLPEIHPRIRPKMADTQAESVRFQSFHVRHFTALEQGRWRAIIAQGGVSIPAPGDDAGMLASQRPGRSDCPILALLVGRPIGSEQLAIVAAVECDDNDQLGLLVTGQDMIGH